LGTKTPDVYATENCKLEIFKKNYFNKKNLVEYKIWLEFLLFWILNQLDVEMKPTFFLQNYTLILKTNPGPNLIKLLGAYLGA
jgi:hypothetical protein